MGARRALSLSPITASEVVSTTVSLPGPVVSTKILRQE
jgi:hypothetical protein